MKSGKLLKVSAALAACAALCIHAGAGNVHAASNVPDAPKAAASDTPKAVGADAFVDENFRALVLKQADTDGDGSISKAEADAVTKLDITYPHKQGHPWYGASLSDLYDYLDMEHAFDGISMDLTGLDTFANLERVRIHNVEPLNLPLAQLKKLDFIEISSIPKMALDFSDAPGLKEIAIVEAEVKELALKKNGALESFKIYNSTLSGGKLDLSALTALKAVTVAHTKLDAVVLGEAADLKELSATDCGLTGISLSGCKNLQRAQLGGNQLKNLDVSGNAQLEYLYVPGSSLTTLDLRGNSKLGTLDISGNQFRKIDRNTLKVSADSALAWVNAGNLSRCTSLDVSHIGALKELLAPSGAFTKVKIAKGLSVLDISSSKMTSLDAKTLQAPKGAALEELHCSLGKLKKMNASHLTNLKQIVAGSNKLAEANVLGCLKLESCHLDGNPLKKLTVSRRSSASQKAMYKKIVKDNGGKLLYR